MRECNICGISKPLEEFEKMPKKKFGRGYRCNQCNRNRRRIPNWSVEREIVCPVCDTTFQCSTASRKYCSKICNDSLEPSRMSNPKRFFQSLMNPQRLNDGLTADICLQLLEKQGGKCALTGREMTFIRGKAAVDTNCSIDRLTPGAPYTADNIQLVCSAVNGFRRNLPLDVFIDWCDAVATKAKGGRN